MLGPHIALPMITGQCSPHGTQGVRFSLRVGYRGHVSVPRTLWLYWAQGWESAPPLVRECRDSWVALNPDWDIRLLDAESALDWVSPVIPGPSWSKMGHAHQAAHIRLQLLTNHGGVWADATCLAFQPLDSWLPHLTTSGFFAFRWLKGDALHYVEMGRTLHVWRMKQMASWFLAAAPGNYIVERLSGRYAQYWTQSLENARIGHGAGKRTRVFITKVVNKLLGVHPRLASIWLNPILAEGLGIRPYLVVNAVFTHLLRTDREFARLWDQTPAVSAVPSHRLQALSLEGSATRAIITEGLACEAPLQKLDWRLPYDEALWNELRVWKQGER